ncbi:uncharacterized protein [Eucyclogobius newberryi]|uniref:uncharacterized protein n=1 Tax=Eucyclogobius newberryi TaxID=166745 RepID=UPI003B590F46
MVPPSWPFLSPLFIFLLPRPAWLYTLHNCTFNMDDPHTIFCDHRQLSRIPSEIPSSVEHLSVSFNNIQKIQQSDFRDFNRLQTLDLIQNQISHIEDAAFSHLSTLTLLDLFQNKLTHLTDNMFKGLFNVTVLYLGYNHIESISEFAFGPLRNLQDLDLSSNFLSQISVIVKVISSCPSLQSLKLGDNRFTSFESEHFSFPLNILKLDLSGQSLRSFMLHSDLFPRLESLHLVRIHSDFQWDVSDKSFLKNLKTLDLSFTNLTIETYKSVFNSVNSLENLRLYGVRLFDKGLADFVCGIPSLQKLDLGGADISVLDPFLLQSCTHLTDLDLYDNSMTDVSESSLRTLTRLLQLNMGLNHLTRVPLTIRNMSSLTSLLFHSNLIKKLHCLDFANLWNLTELNLANNYLVELNGCIFKDLHSLQRLYVDNNFLFQFDDSFGTSLSNLLSLSANNNNIAWLQNGVFKNMSHLNYLKLSSVRGTIMERGAWNGLTNLTYLGYSLSIGSSKPGASFKSDSSTGGRSQHIQSFNLPSLKELQISVPSEVCLIYPDDFLQGLDGLTSFSAYSLFCKSPDIETFHSTPLLKFIEMANNLDLNLYPELFQPIRNLQSLELPDNHLKSLDFLSQANLTELQRLDLSNNDLRVINESFFEALPSLRYLDLSNNPFVCNCSNAGFIHWVLYNKQVFVGYAFRLRCASPQSYEGHLLLDFDVQSCWEFTSFLCFMSSSALVLITLLSSFIHHFLRWQLVYGFYLVRAYLYHSKKRRQGCAHTYDAFVSYNVHDEDWVCNELVPELEERQGWKLCLHHRDFQPGRAILENITDAIYSSRKTLCVISRQYLQSEWCSREIQMASFRLLDEQKDVLILLFLEELSSNQLSPFYRMRKLLRSRTYLSWSRARSHRGLFWEKVRCAMQCGAELANNPLPAQV